MKATHPYKMTTKDLADLVVFTLRHADESTTLHERRYAAGCARELQKRAAHEPIQKEYERRNMK